MKPREITHDTFDVNVAVLEMDDLEVRMWASGEAMGFELQSGRTRIGMAIPIATWNQIVDLVNSFKKKTSTTITENYTGS